MAVGPTLDEQLNRLEEDIRRLKVEMDIFFSGGSKRPPFDSRNRVETTIRRLSDNRALRFEQRYRFSSLCARYNVFRDLWRRLLDQREVGQLRTGYFKATEPSLGEESPGASDRVTVTFTNPSAESDKLEQLFKAVLKFKELAGESTEKFSIDQFAKLIASRTTEIKQVNHCNSVTYLVTLENGRVRFTAKGQRD